MTELIQKYLVDFDYTNNKDHYENANHCLEHLVETLYDSIAEASVEAQQSSDSNLVDYIHKSIKADLLQIENIKTYLTN